MSSESEYDTVLITYFSFYSIFSHNLPNTSITGRLFYPFVSIDLYLLCPVSIVAIVENNEIRLENNDISGHILPALFFNRLTLVSLYSAFSSVRRTDANVLNCSKHSRPSGEWRRMQNNAIREWSEWRIMRGECDPKYRYSLIVSHYSLARRGGAEVAGWTLDGKIRVRFPAYPHRVWARR